MNEPCSCGNCFASIIASLAGVKIVGLLRHGYTNITLFKSPGIIQTIPYHHYFFSLLL
jgi:hypothetical protein